MRDYWCVWINSIFVGTFTTHLRAQAYCDSKGWTVGNQVEIRCTPMCVPTEANARLRFKSTLDNPDW